MAVLNRRILMSVPALAAATLSALAPLAEASSLNQYRAKLGSQHVTVKAGVQRAQRLRKLLGTQAYAFPGIQDPKGVIAQTLAQTGSRGRKTSSSGYFKMMLERYSRELVEREQYQKPESFDPSEYVASNGDVAAMVESKIRNRRLEFCRHRWDKDFPLALSQFRQQLASSARAPLPPVDATSRALIAAISGYIAAAQPRVAPAQRIEAVLGPVQDVEYVDGHVSRIVFANSQGQKVPASLSMLVTFRSGDDEYFVALADCFNNYVEHYLNLEKEVKEKRAKRALSAAEEKQYTEDFFAGFHFAHTGTVAQLATAQAVHQKLASLTRPQLDFLLDLFLQVRRQDVPAEAEMFADNQQAVGLSVVNYMYSLTKPEVMKAARDRAASLESQGKKAEAQKVLAEASAREAQVLADYEYYDLMNRQLRRLENVLRAERTRAEKKREIIGQIKGGK